MLRTRLALGLLALALPACGGGGGGGGGAPPDPLAVVQRIPAASATGVVRTANLYIRLSRAAAPATVNTTNVILALGGIGVARTVSFDPGTLLLTINPDAALNQLGTYTVTLTAGLTDLAGVPVTPETYTITANNNTDGTPPAFAGAFSVSARTLTSIDLQWPTATDATAPIEYQLFTLSPGASFDPTSSPSDTVSATSISLGGLVSDTGFQYRVRARDGAGNLSDTTLALTTKTLTSFVQDVWTGIISNNMRCTKCHMPGGQMVVPFTMETAPIARGNLVNVDATCNVGPGVLPAGTKRVLPSNGPASFLYQKIAGTPICGVRMPHDGNVTGYLQDSEIQTIRDWIDEGALDN